MTVKELIELLEKEDPDRLVICQRDSEGNRFSPLSMVWIGAYRADNEWCGFAGMEELTEADLERGYTDEDLVDGVKALMLVPIN